MSGIANTASPVYFNTRFTGFDATYGANGKVLVEPQASAAAAGNLPVLFGGASVVDLLAASTDSATKDIIIYKGEVLTTQGTSPTGTLATTATTNGTITRVNNSFITDGWKVGDMCMLFTPDTVAQVATGIDGIASVITAVAALTLTVKGVTFAANATLTAGTRVVRIGQQFRYTIPVNAGNTAAIASVKLLNNTNDGSNIRNEIKLGPTSMLIGVMVAAPSADPACITVSATYGIY